VVFHPYEFRFGVIRDSLTMSMPSLLYLKSGHSITAHYANHRIASTSRRPASIFRATEFELLGIGLSVGPKKIDSCANFEIAELATDDWSEDARALVQPH
jgi:hypothetical protein